MAKKAVPLQNGYKKRTVYNEIQKTASEPIAKYRKLYKETRETQKSRSELASEYKKVLQQGASMAEARKKVAQKTYPAKFQKTVSDNRHKESSPEAIHKNHWRDVESDTVTMNGRVRRKQNNPVSVEENRRMLEKGFVQKYSVPEPWKPTSQNRPVMKPDPRPQQRKVNDVGLKYKKKR